MLTHTARARDRVRRRNLGALTAVLGPPQLTLSPTKFPHASAFAKSQGGYEYGGGGCAANHVRFVGSPPDLDGDGELDDPSNRYFDECEVNVSVADRLIPANMTEIVGPGNVGIVAVVSSWALNNYSAPAGPLAFTTRTCAVVEPYAVIDCTLPPGVGRRLAFRIEVLSQVSLIVTTNLEYSAPRLMPLSGPANISGYSVTGTNRYAGLVPYDATTNCSMVAFTAISCTILDGSGNAVVPTEFTIFATLSFEASSGTVNLSSPCMPDPLILWSSAECVAAAAPNNEEVDVYSVLARLACEILLGACEDAAQPPDTPLTAFNVSTVAAFASGLPSSVCGACMRTLVLSEPRVAVDTGGATVHLGVKSAGTTMPGQSTLTLGGAVQAVGSYWYATTSHLVVRVPDWGTDAARRLQVRVFAARGE